MIFLVDCKKNIGEEVIRDPVENPGLRDSVPAARRNSQGTHHQVVSSPHPSERIGVPTPLRPEDQMLPCNADLGGESHGTANAASVTGISPSISGVAGSGTESPRDVLGVVNESSSCLEMPSNPGVVHSDTLGNVTTLDGDGNAATAEALVATFLGIDEEWALSCIESQVKRRRLDEEASASSPTAEPITSVQRPDVDTEGLRVLLELCDEGFAVSWPSGFDQISARSYLGNMKTYSKPCDYWMD